MQLSSALRYLDAHTNLEATAGRVEGLSLDRMKRLVEVLGDPQSAYPVVHITGTNGKGSVARMVTRLLKAQGLSVGTYASPHLERINERVAWDGDAIDDDSLGHAIGAIAAVEGLAGVIPSYFEILTAAAFGWFAEVAVDVAVVEVGMLGRWDATNVVDASVAVCTNVGRDHTDGSPGWRQAIAEEKAGIVTPGLTDVLVLGETDPDLLAVFAAAGAIETWRRDVDFGVAADRVAVGGRLVDLRTPDAHHEDVYLPVHGAHQSENASAAVAAAEAFLGRGQSASVVEEAFAELTLPGRFEVLRRHPTVVVDAAHNPEGAASAAATLAEDMTLPGSVLMVVGLLAGRDPAEILAALGASDAGLLVVCAPDSPRALPTSEVAAAASRLGAVVEVVADPVDALHRALSVATEDDLVLVAGSLYVAGPVRAAVREMEVST